MGASRPMRGGGASVRDGAAGGGRGETLADLRRRLDDLTRLVSDWVWETDRDLRLVMVSARVFELLGFHPVELLGRRLLEIGRVRPESGAETEPVWRSPFRDVLFETTHRDGRPRLFLISALPVYDGRSGAFQGVRGTAVDITERRRAEQALIQSEMRYRAVVEEQSELIRRSLPDGTLTFVNNAYCRYFDRRRQDLIGARFQALLPEPARAAMEARLEALAAGDEPGPIEIEVSGPGGTPRWLHWSDRAIRDAGGTVVEVQSVGWDVTERRNVEEALRASEERHRIFAANVAHELRTPMAILRAQIDALEDAATARSMREDLNRMARLIEQLLAATRLDALAIQSEEIADLHALCTRVAAYLAPIAVKESRSIEVVGEGAPVLVRGNEHALEQAVRNLVENAIRYAARGTVVTIQVTDEPAVRVIDHGPGVPPDQRSAIFQRFRRGDQSSGGAGLGLSIVKVAVEAHGGIVDVGDAPGGGAVFTIRLPRLAD